MIFWLASYPKSGNTWVRMFWRSYFLPSNQVFSLNKRGNLDLEVFNFPTADQLKEANVDHTDFRNIAKNWITLQDIINLNNKLNFLKTHNGNFTLNNYAFTNTDNTIGGIYIVRDPRDVVLSNANHFGIDNEESTKMLLNMESYEIEDFDIDKKEKFRKSLMGSWSSNYLSWKNYKGRKIHLMKYENLVENPRRVFTKMLEYMKSIFPVDIDPDRVRKAVEETAFDKLQNLEDKEGFTEVGMGKFFRKGKVGEWKEKLDPKLVKIIEDHFRKEMMELNYL